MTTGRRSKTQALYNGGEEGEGVEEGEEVVEVVVKVTVVMGFSGCCLEKSEAMEWRCARMVIDNLFSIAKWMLQGGWVRCLMNGK